MPLDLLPYADPLSRTPIVLRAVVEGRSDAWLDSRHAPDVASPRETVAHLLLCEAEESWIDRVRHVMDDAHVFPVGPYAGMGDAEFATRPLSELLDEFESWRRRNVRELEGLGLTEGDLQAGRSYEEGADETVGQLLATWVAHDLYHLGQIFKSYSALYVERIGPYQRFLNLPHFN